MIWLAWRQQRVALLVLGGYVLLLTFLMTYYRATMLAVVDAQGLGPCVVSHYESGCLPNLTPTVWGWYETADNIRMALIGYGVLVGVFLGAPLFAREFEQHTHLLALTQSARPSRWFTAKVAVVVVPAALGALLLGALFRWWTAALGKLLVPREGFHAALFEPQPPALFGYAVFAVGLGAVVGLAVRRVVPAMALTLVGWLAALYGVRRFVRMHYMSPVVVERPFDDDLAGYRADEDRWRLDDGVVDATGRFISDRDEVVREASRSCEISSYGSHTPAYEDCMTALGYRSGADLVQPGDRFWWFQGIESALFTGAGVLCVLGAMWWLHRRFRRELRVPAAT
ncbi:hypothetical protein [Saccharothrix variisporea]|uniref:ABC-2 family transporter n=1 Tax=Saccharothrix variisporea TaxID=543527 RepID=A0A495X614_9PSEU|nr:hypothetical protein [Saccharothrix variisporea]RKT68996.1 hypothetical protein DFJ66_2189 [Saccharothrix variisporea]